VEFGQVFSVADMMEAKIAVRQSPLWGGKWFLDNDLGVGMRKGVR
jgi:nitrogen fixation protein